MYLISHRGNINGKKPELENSPEYIDKAIDLGYDVEIDIRLENDKFYLGHDNAKYYITLEWLTKRSNKLWIHCKNISAVEALANLKNFNYFWHQTDDITLTSKSFIWAYPGKQPIKQSIAVLPEINNDNIIGCSGVCSDIIEEYNESSFMPIRNSRL